MRCKGCVYWDQQSEPYTQKGMHGDTDIQLPASSLCTYPVPIWAGYGLTAAEDGVSCHTFKDMEAST